ncbi:beta-mannosidase [Sphingomonas faeni]|uniref:beta-mannosidase n=1 Tax=Sphingomonas faeni TaxID=185950 RepID=UPI0020C8188D|nr:glycoside hydrolase family 2 protein [Sphingomonas faeni]MCP8889330.1 glycoside hydrolase family 2 protein [Sphingomonas faeni]
MRWTVLLLLASAATPVWAAPSTSVVLDSGWSMRIDPADTAAAKAHPKAARWLRATVPGSAQTDLMAAKIVPDPYKGLNEAKIQWVGLTDWQYRTTLRMTAEQLARDHVDLVFDGLDTFAEVRLNGTKLLAADNAHRRWRVPVKAVLKPGANDLLITFRSPIRTLQPMVLKTAHPLPGEYDSIYGDEPMGKQTSPYIRKPKYQYGWDWGPRIVTQGIWRPARIEAWDDARIEAFRVTQEALTKTEARLSAELDVVAGEERPVTVQVAVTGPDGQVTQAARTVTIAAGASHVAVPVSIANPQRWFPAGYGAQPLYTVKATLTDGTTTIDTAQRRTGLRTVELRREKDAQGRGFAFVVNGIPVFAKGANLIPFDMFPARVPESQIRTVMAGARDANMNMIRVWGGGYYLDDAFYDIADQMGLMVWQDFMFGGSITPPDREFRETVRIEAEEQVDRLQAHPSIVMWAGNNEVLSGWANWSDRIAYKKAVGADEQERIGVGMAVIFDRVLRDAAERRDPDAVYWPGSPSSNYEDKPDIDGDGDRHYWDVWGGKKPVEAYLDSCPRFMSEYGLQSMPEMKTIRTFATDADFSPTSPVMKAHQKFLKGEGNDRLLFYIREKYREPRDFAEFVYLSQVMQAEGIELAALHHRACRPVTMGSLFWQINDVWPGASWASIDYYGRWKALQFRARHFYAPLAIAAERKDGSTKVSLISDATTPTEAVWRMRALDVDGKVLATTETPATLPPLSATAVATLPDATLFAGGDSARTIAVAELLVDGRVTSRVLVSAAPKTMTLPDPGLTATWETNRLTLTATNLARAVWLDFGKVEATPSDNAFDLLPGESVTVTVASKASAAALKRALTIRTLAGQVVPK